MVYNTRRTQRIVDIIQNYWVSGLCPSSRILHTSKYNVSETVYDSETLCFLTFRILDDGQSPETQ
jgi:hypothetical protein